MVTSRGAAGCRTVVNDAEGQLLLFADDAEARRADDLDAAVELIRLAADQPVDRRVEAELLVDIGHVVDLAVGDEDRAADPCRRHIGKRRRSRREKSRVDGASLSSLSAASTMRVSICGKRDSRSLRSASALSVCSRAAGIVLALAAVDDDGDDGRQRLALLLEEDRIGQRQAEGGKGCRHAPRLRARRARCQAQPELRLQRQAPPDRARG